MIVFTLFLLLMMLLMGGIAVDMMRFETNRSRLQGAIDRAVLAAADLDVCLDLTKDPAAVVQDYVARSGFGGLVHNITVDRGFNSCIVTADARIDVNTIFMPWANVDQLGTPASSGATESIDEVEVSLVLDVSGSMGRDGRIEALRIAGADFVETIIDSIEDGHVSISIVPYSTQVNIGPNVMAQYLTRYNHAYSYCLDLPSNLYGRTDIPVQTRYDQAAHFDADSGYNTSYVVMPSTNNWVCNPSPDRWILPFSDNILQMQTFIGNLNPSGWTSIEMGAKWGIAMLDPGSQTVATGLIALGDVDAEYLGRPLAFNTSDSLKVMVLMTDGENTRDYVLSSNYRHQPSDTWLLPNATWRGDRYYVDEEEVNDTDGDGRWRERYWVTDYQNVSYTDEYWVNTRLGTRLTWQDTFARMSIKQYAWSMHADQYNNYGLINNWWDNLVTVTYTAQKDARLAQICSAAKAQGIVIFGIGFNVTDRAAQVMSSCASSPNHFYRVADLDIDSAFDSIANQISQLRLIQ